MLLVGLAVSVESVALGGETGVWNTTVGVVLSVTPSPTTVTVFVPELVLVTVPVVTPLASVTAGEEQLAPPEAESVTVFPTQRLSRTSFKVTVMVEESTPSALTHGGKADVRE